MCQLCDRLVGCQLLVANPHLTDSQHCCDSQGAAAQVVEHGEGVLFLYWEADAVNIAALGRAGSHTPASVMHLLDMGLYQSSIC